MSYTYTNTVKLELILNAHSLVIFLPLDGVRVLQPNIFFIQWTFIQLFSIVITPNQC